MPARSRVSSRSRAGREALTQWLRMGQPEGARPRLGARTSRGCPRRPRARGHKQPAVRPGPAVKGRGHAARPPPAQDQHSSTRKSARCGPRGWRRARRGGAPVAPGPGPAPPPRAALSRESVPSGRRARWEMPVRASAWPGLVVVRVRDGRGRDGDSGPGARAPPRRARPGRAPGRDQGQRTSQRVAAVAREGTSLQQHLSREGREESGQGPQERRLARSVGADHGQRLSRGEGQVQAMQHGHLAAAHAEATRLQHPGHDRPSAARSASRK